MSATKAVRFDMMAIGDRFKFADTEPAVFEKVSTTKAHEAGRADGVPFRVKASAVVTAIIPADAIFTDGVCAATGDAELLRDLREQLGRWLLSSKEVRDQMAVDLFKDFGYTLRWSEKAFEAAAKGDVARRLLEYIDGDGKEKAPADVLSSIRQEALRMGLRGASRSTSPAANMYEDAVRDAWARIAQGGYLL